METTKQKRINVLDTLNTIDISFNNKLDIDSLDILINNKRKIGKHSNCDKYGMIDFLNNIEFSDGYIFNDEDELFNFIKVALFFNTFFVLYNLLHSFHLY